MASLNPNGKQQLEGAAKKQSGGSRSIHKQLLQPPKGGLRERFRVWGLGFGVWGLGFGVWGLGFNHQRWSKKEGIGPFFFFFMGEGPGFVSLDLGP